MNSLDDAHIDENDLEDFEQFTQYYGLDQETDLTDEEEDEPKELFF